MEVKTLVGIDPPRIRRMFDTYGAGPDVKNTRLNMAIAT
jgi:hypothetical protein